MMMGPFMKAFATNGTERAEADHNSAEERPTHDADLRETVEELKKQIAALRRELGRR
jgi:uncharacterized protein YceH (UPF0502 family)